MGVNATGNAYGNIKVDDDGRVKMGKQINGVDLNEVEDNYVSVQQKRIQSIQDIIDTNNNKKIPAMEDMRSKAIALQQSLALLTNDVSGLCTGTNAFISKIALSQQTDGALTLTVGQSTAVSPTPYSVNVLQIATQDQIQSRGFTDPDATDIFADGETIVLNGHTIPMTSSTSLNSLVTNINQATCETSGVQARVEYISESVGYTLILTSGSVASPINLNGTSISQKGENSLRFPTSITPTTNLIAKLTINGISYERTSNTITDIQCLNGTTLQLYKQSTAPTQFSIEYDKQAAISAIGDFVTNYNALNDALSAQQKTLSDGYTPDPSAILFGESLIQSVQNILYANINNVPIGVTDSHVKSLADLGIILNKTTSDGVINTSGALAFDTAMLSNAVYTHYTDVVGFFGNQSKSTNSSFTTYGFPPSLSSALAGKPITLTYTHNDNGTYSATLQASEVEDVTLLNVQKGSLVGPANTPYKGLFIQYEGADPGLGNSVTAQVTLTQGMSIDFSAQLSKATQKRSSVMQPPLSIFDSTADILLKNNDMQKKNIESINSEITLLKKRFQSHFEEIFAADCFTKHIQETLQARIAHMFEGH
jgi:flagellar hook-associated protein 2